MHALGRFQWFFGYGPRRAYTGKIEAAFIERGDYVLIKKKWGKVKVVHHETTVVTMEGDTENLKNPSPDFRHKKPTNAWANGFLWATALIGAITGILGLFKH